MKFRLILISLLVIIIIFGMIIPNGIRAAVANNIWTLSFIKEVAQSEGFNPQDFSPPPSHRHAGMLLANQALKQDQVELASTYMTPLIDNPDRLVLNTYANINFLQGYYERAIAIWKDLGLWATLQYAAVELRNEGKFDQAILASRSGYELFPVKSADNLLTNLMIKANYLLEQNRYTEAISEYLAIINQFPGNGSPYMGLTQAYWQNDQPAMAFQIIEQGWDLNTTNPQFFTIAADIFEQAGLIDSALQAYQKALEINPDNPTALQGVERLLGVSE